METKLMQVFLNVIAIFLLLAFVAIWVLGFYLVVTNPKEPPIFSLLTPSYVGLPVTAGVFVALVVYCWKSGIFDFCG